MTALPISELAERSGCSVATIKYYLREGLLHPGVKVNARRTAFDETHLARLRLVRGLIHVVGVTIEQAGTILDLVADPHQSVVGAMRKATAALPTGDRSSSAAGEAAPARSTAATEALLDRLGVQHTADSVPVAQLDRALELAEEAGIPLDESQIRTYVDAVRDIADADFSRVPWSDPQGAVEFAVLATALYEPVLLALRRVAHHDKGPHHGARRGLTGSACAPPASRRPSNAPAAGSGRSMCSSARSAPARTSSTRPGSAAAPSRITSPPAASGALVPRAAVVATAVRGGHVGYALTVTTAAGDAEGADGPVPYVAWYLNKLQGFESAATTS